MGLGERTGGRSGVEVVFWVVGRVVLGLIVGCWGLLGQGGSGVGRYLLRGVVVDSFSREALPFAQVEVVEAKKVFQAGPYGNFSVWLRGGVYTVRVRAVGYVERAVRVEVNRDVVVQIGLVPVQRRLRAVEVRSRRRSSEEVSMSKIRVPIRTLREIPVAFGEQDPIRALRMLPGVQSAGDATPGLVVRGGTPDQVLILLDEAVVYNPGHLFGLFSVFNPDALHSVTLFRGGIPARYGNRLSAVLDVRMREGNLRKYRVRGGLGLISSRLAVEGPLVRDRASFMVAGRRTYFDLLFGKYLKTFTYNFYDLNMKMNFRLGESMRFYLSGYFGRDQFYFKEPEGSFQVWMPWGNQTVTARMTRMMKGGGFLLTTLTYNEFRSSMEVEERSLQVVIASYIRDLSARVDYQFAQRGSHLVRSGVSLTHHTFSPLAFALQTDEKPSHPRKKYVLDGAVYVEDEWQVGRRLGIEWGLRYTFFAHLGPYVHYLYGGDGRPYDSVEYGWGRVIRVYHGGEPRLSVRYRLDSFQSVKGSVMYIQQYLQLVSNSALTTPFDLWIPSSLLVKPARMLEFALSYVRDGFRLPYSVSLGLYYRYLWNLLEFKDNYVPDVNHDPEYSLVRGTGESYGLEASVEYDGDWLTLLVGYTLSWNWRYFPELNGGRRFPSRYDRRHDLSVLVLWKLGWRWRFGLTFVYGTGNTATLPTEFYLIRFMLVPHYTARNNFRLPPYHRMDLSVTYRFRIAKKYMQELILTLYNVYNRQNIFFIWLSTRGDWQTGIYQKFYQVTLFPFLPTLTWNFRF